MPIPDHPVRHLDLLIAAPSDPQGLLRWGDYHFARELQLALHRLGVSSRLLFRDSYRRQPEPAAGSGLLVLRGKFAPRNDWLACSSYAHKVAWLISWPLAPTPGELARYDLLLVASLQDRARIAAISGRPTHTLLQATAFGGRGRPQSVGGELLFVGSYRGVERPTVADFTRAGLPLKLIGEGWDEVGLKAAASTIANHELPRLYGQALAVLNDHHGAMADYGYLNNRVFDVLACGVPVITDAAPGCPKELEAGVIRHRRGDDPASTIRKADKLRSDHRCLAPVAAAVRDRHSFDARAVSLLEVLDVR
ncbi:glycosyltransferase family 1 protein [Cyanobium sp. ATX 6A2]|uniref:glycosyltransferase family protein n=1 Tax=Cyanobium sp. ATX 6A2 TaxID=2823700 RepID=UPI0020CE2CA5|nr:glycosyltransferase [Cyanobium sp. ATX 6A2]MCP9889257.1 glycosyltransferase family 1 protein [Cyanobium sp. ATX 6A2]